MHWEGEMEGRPSAEFAFDRDSTAMRGYDISDDLGAQAGSAWL